MFNVLPVKAITILSVTLATPVGNRLVFLVEERVNFIAELETPTERHVEVARVRGKLIVEHVVDLDIKYVEGVMDKE